MKINNNSGQQYAASYIVLVFLIFMSSFDSFVIPYTRFSIADLTLFSILIIVGFSKKTFIFSMRRVLTFWLCFIILSIVNSVGYQVTYDLNVSFINSITGVFRPLFFSLIAALFYAYLKLRMFNYELVCLSFLLSGALISGFVFFQYLGLFPPMYFNNPAFGEVGRWMSFSEGWRPTGLTNEASFVGIYIVLVMVFAFYVKSVRFVKYANILLFICSLGCFFTTSRLALIISLLISFFYLKPKYRFILFLPMIITLVSFFDMGRFYNLLSFDGDASTIERYGSNISYIKAWLDNIISFMPGYLNANVMVYGYVDPIVVKVLDNRELTAFSLPLQMLVEFGSIGCFALLILIYLLNKDWFFSFFCLVFFFVSLTTGIQNFLFVYIYIAGSIYVKSSHCTQENWWRSRCFE